ncbi:MAG: hypothetical protein HQL77_06035 [Magnetococcales bacterium]|nr:hypothetical protein [Magnetococcales bacterium]
MTADSLFKLYGELVSDLFALESCDILYPGAGLKSDTDAIPGKCSDGDCLLLPDASYKSSASLQRGFVDPLIIEQVDCGCSKSIFQQTLREVIDADDREKIIRVVNHYRQKLYEEEQLATADYKSKGLALKRFREHLHSGSEEGLEDNPFYKIVLMIFHSSRMGLFHSLSRQILERMQPLPAYISFAPSIREIWRRPRAFGGVFSNMVAILKAYAILLYNPVAFLLYIGAACAISLAANHFLQSPVTSEYLPTIQGLEGESSRYLIATLVGVVISTVVLDFKDRLLQAMAESGGIFAGIRNAFLISPRWMTVALFCTLFTVKASNDIIMTLFSGKERMAVQAKAIEATVQVALGSDTSSTSSGSLSDFQVILSNTINAQIELMEQLPSNESGETASYRDSRKGPRFWAEHFIIHGGYEPGISDVSISNSTPLSKTLDTILAGSGIDFSSSFREKSQSLQETCHKNWAQTRVNVHRWLAQLRQMHDIRDQSLLDFMRFLLAEPYSVNNLIAAVRAELDNTRSTCQQIAEDFSDLTRSYLEILRQVNPSGTFFPDDVTNRVAMETSPIQAIDALDTNKFSRVGQLGIVEFATMLGEWYGPTPGLVLMMIFLFLAGGMVLGDLMLFAHLLARSSRRDQAQVPLRLEELKAWENSFIDMVVESLSASQAKCLIGYNIKFNKIAIELHYYKMIEKYDPETKHPRDRNIIELILLWYFGMFTLKKPLWARSYNVRLAAVRRLIHPEKSNLVDWLHCSFFGRMSNRNLWRSSLTTISRRMTENNSDTKKEIDQIFFHRLDHASKISKMFSMENTAHSSDKSIPIFIRFGFLLGRIHSVGTAVFLQGFKPQPVWFPLTFYHWRMKFFTRLEQYSNLRTQLHRIQPEIHIIYEKSISTVYSDILYPIIEIKKKYGECFSMDWEKRFAELESNLNVFERKVLETLGVLPLMSAATSLGELVEILEYIESIMDLNSNIIMEVINFIDTGCLFSDMEEANFGQQLIKEGQKLLQEANEQLAKVREEEIIRWKEVEGIADLLDERLVEVRTLFRDISSLFLRIRQKETDFSTHGYPSLIVRTNHQMNQTLVNMAPKEADQILVRMENILTARHPYTAENLTTVELLKRDSKALYDRLDSYVTSIMEAPFPSIHEQGH